MRAARVEGLTSNMESANTTQGYAVQATTTSFERVAPDIGQIHRLLGIRPERGNHRRWMDEIDSLLRTLPRLMRPRAVYRLDRVVELSQRRLALESGAVFEGSVGQFLAHSTYVATFIATIGSAVERLSRGWLKAGRVMQGTIADAIASESAEATAQRCQDEIRAWARPRGLDVTPRYSPGYCGIKVAQQAELFAGLPAADVNVRLTPSSLMVPIKSVSGLIGIGPAEKVSPEGYPCTYCDHPHCMQRRAPLATNTGTCFEWGLHTS
jgi:hypothetical protein